MVQWAVARSDVGDSREGQGATGCRKSQWHVLPEDQKSILKCKRKESVWASLSLDRAWSGKSWAWDNIECAGGGSAWCCQVLESARQNMPPGGIAPAICKASRIREGGRNALWPWGRGRGGVVNWRIPLRDEEWSQLPRQERQSLWVAFRRLM